MVSGCVGAGDLFVADEIFIGVEDAIADGDGEVVDGEAVRSGWRVECDELTHDALVGVGSDASLREGAAGGKNRCEGRQEEETGSECHFARSLYWSRKLANRITGLKNARSLYCEKAIVAIGRKVEIFPNPLWLAAGESVGWRPTPEDFDGFDTIARREGAVCSGTAVPQADASPGT